MIKGEMDDRPRPLTSQLGMVSATAVLLFGTAYAVVLALGFLSAGAPDQPIGDPWFSILELLIIVMMPAMVALMAAIHVWAPAHAKALSLSSLIFMSMTAALTVGIHFTILALGQAPLSSGAPWAPLILSFRWPSIAYALDILAWDLFFPLSMLFAAPVFRASPLARTIRTLMIVSGVLAFGGLSGVFAGDMRLRNFGILGYAGVFLVVVALLAVFFQGDGRLKKTI